MTSLSRRARQTPQSPIRKLSPLAEKARQAGTSVYHLNIGQPDIKAPREFFEGLLLFKDEVIAYEPSRGSSELLAAWSAYMNQTLHLSTSPENFLITTGASEALVFAFMACCDPDDEILVFDPTYANYIGFAALSGITLVPVRTRIEENFAIPGPAEIVSRITPKTKAILLCNPNNPTGTVYTREELSLLLAICNERNLFFIVDETYREFVYDGATPLSVFHLEGAMDRVIVVDSLSKRFSLCGARLGCLISMNPDVTGVVRVMAQARLSSPTIEQFAAAHMLKTIKPAFVEAVIAEYALRRDVLYRTLSGIDGVVVHRPQGAFYSIVRLPVTDAEVFCTFLLSEFSHKGKTTFLAPAGGFYLEKGRGGDEVRVAYVLNTSDIEGAVEVLHHGLRQFHEVKGR